jgi:signal peptidase I
MEPPKATRRSVLTLLMAVTLATLIMFVVRPMKIVGISMQPTINDEDHAFFLLKPFIATLERGDIIAFISPEDPKENLIKRIVGLPNETIEVKPGGSVLINGKLLEEPYVREPEHNPYPLRVTIPQNSYFVMGDNRPHSGDSRQFGAIPKNLIFGKTLFFYWPFDKMFAFRNLKPHLSTRS